MIRAVIFDMYETLITQYSNALYFGTHMAADGGISLQDFRRLWVSSEHQRTLGYMTFDEVIKAILEENNAYTDAKYAKILKGRRDAKKEQFNHLHEHIIPMFEQLHKEGIRTALISNCYREEEEIIRESILYPYFDEVSLSCREHIAKPDERIFTGMLEKLNLKAEECLYIGDGGSSELQAASAVGMHAMQAVWYLAMHQYRQGSIQEGFIQLDDPLDVIVQCHNLQGESL